MWVSFSVTTDCKSGPIGLDYEGTVSQTKTGLECQRWASNEPHRSYYTNETENHCRNPDGESGRALVLYNVK